MALAWPRLDCGGLGRTGRPRACAGCGAPGGVGGLREGGGGGQQGRGPERCSWPPPFSRLAGWFRPGRPPAGWSPSCAVPLRRGASSVAGRKEVERAWTRRRPMLFMEWFMAIKRDSPVLESDLEEEGGGVERPGRGRRRPGAPVSTGLPGCSVAGASLVAGGPWRRRGPPPLQPARRGPRGRGDLSCPTDTQASHGAGLLAARLLHWGGAGGAASAWGRAGGLAGPAWRGRRAEPPCGAGREACGLCAAIAESEKPSGEQRAATHKRLHRRYPQIWTSGGLGECDAARGRPHQD